MEIKIVDKSFNTDEITINNVSYFIENICNILEFSHNHIEKVIFADDENYGKEIKNIEPNEDYTNTSMATGFGKTIYLLDTNSNIIIIRSIIYIGIVKIINKIYIDKLKVDNIDIQIILIILLHEIGHCITNCKFRKSIYSKKYLHISLIPKYYFEIILDEFHANRSIVSLISKDWVIYELSNNYINEFNLLSKSLKCFSNNEYVQNIWYFFKRFMDIGAFLIDCNDNEYNKYLSKIEVPFDISILLDSFYKYNKTLISENDLFIILSEIVKKIKGI